MAVTIGAGLVAIALFLSLISISYLIVPTVTIKTNDTLHNGTTDVSEQGIISKNINTVTNHTHAALMVFVNGIVMNFSDLKYQNKDIAMHFEGGDGFTLHKHVRNSWLGPFFESINMTLADNCLLINENQTFCSNFNKQISFFVNGKINQQFEHYSPHENDRILVSYGNSFEVPSQQNLLNKIKMNKS